MVSIMEIMQLCRLCLVKEQVNIPIFEEQDDVRQICLKITSCLPVKITKEDKLPKKICDGCLYKLELLYQFYNTTANAEKQLLTWIEQINMDANEKNLENLAAQSTPPTVKQEKLEPVESTNENPDMSAEAQNYMLDQETFQPDFTFKESQGSTADAVDAAENSDEPLAKRPRRGRPRQATKPIPPESLDSSDNDNDNDDAGDSMLEMTVTKTEEESESEGEENVDDPEPTKFEAVGEDTEQPGPSGLGKGGADGPSRRKSSQMSVNAKKDNKKNKPPKLQKGDRHNGGQKKWSCSKCTQTFSAERQWRKHRKEFHKRVIKIDQFEYFYDQGEDIYFCDNCPTKCKSQSEMEAHVKTHDQYTCFVCNDTFYSLYKFSVHNETHEPGCFICPLCAYQTNKRCLIQNHINTTHLRKFRHICDLCGEGFQDVGHYKDHKDKHAGAKAIACVVCQREFKFRTGLLKHQQWSHTAHIGGEAQDQCKICKITFKSPVYLKKHLLQHDTKRHLCDVCGKAFSDKGLLDTHRIIHTNIKEYKCNYCTKAFSKREYLVMHERIHTGERPFACEYCEKAFNQRTALKRHIRGHTGERPYVCHICKKGFISKDTLNLHFRRCNG